MSWPTVTSWPCAGVQMWMLRCVGVCEVAQPQSSPRTPTRSRLGRPGGVYLSRRCDLTTRASDFPRTSTPNCTPSIPFRSGALPCRSGNSSRPARPGPSDELGLFQGVGSRAGLGGQRARSSPSSRPPTGRPRSSSVLSRQFEVARHTRRRRLSCSARSFWPANRDEPFDGWNKTLPGSMPRGKHDVAEEGKAMAGWGCERGGECWVHRAVDCTVNHIRF